MDGGPGYAADRPPLRRSLIAALAPAPAPPRPRRLSTSAAPAAPSAVHCPALQKGLIQEPIAVGECANQLGPRFAGYTTAEAADDIDAVRRALGLGKVFLYGDSYGTLFGPGLRGPPPSTRCAG